MEPLTRLNRRDALAFAAARPFENAFVQWVLEGGHGQFAPDEIFLDRRGDGAVRALAYYGAQLVVAADDDAGIDAVAEHTRNYPFLRSIVGPSRVVAALWSRIERWHRPPVLTRDRQPLYALWPHALERIDDVGVRLARLEETTLISDHSANMIEGELGYDPRDQRASFVASVRRAIELGWWWVWVVDGEVRFQCNIGARTPATAQIQGVWTPPKLRGKGYATRALAAIARRLLADCPTVSLYVNDFNAPAIALYERLGFTHVGELATYLFP